MTNSFAYQEGKGILDAVQLAKTYIEDNNNVVVEIDLKNYFDTINLSRLFDLIQDKISDELVLELISKYLYCKLSIDDEIVSKTMGIVQGNPMSPILSNLYLHEFDCYLQGKGYKWIRFADNPFRSFVKHVPY